jgi:GH15 family glucan-1,4-alpha-glucosidase
VERARQAFAESFGGNVLDASVLLMAEVNFIDPKDPRFISTLKALEERSATGRTCGATRRRTISASPRRPSISARSGASTRWRASAARGSARNLRGHAGGAQSAGLLSEDTHPVTGEMWGNFPQTYSMVGLINGAMRLSAPGTA